MRKSGNASLDGFQRPPAGSHAQTVVSLHSSARTGANAGASGHLSATGRSNASLNLGASVSDRPKPAPLQRGDMDHETWWTLITTLNAVPGLKRLDESFVVEKPLELHAKHVPAIGVGCTGLVDAGQHKKACELLMMLTPDARAQVLKGMGKDQLKAFSTQGTQQSRALFEKAVFGTMEHACKRVGDTDSSVHRETLAAFETYLWPYSRARLALMSGAATGFWKAYDDCTDQQKRELALFIPEEFQESSGERQVSSLSLSLQLKKEMAEGFTRGLQQGLAVCERWLNQADAWAATDPVHCAIIRHAVEQALDGNPVAACDAVKWGERHAALSGRCAIGALTPALLKAAPEAFRASLIALAVEQAVNAPLDVALVRLNQLVDCFQALHKAPHADLAACASCLFVGLSAGFDGLLDPGRQLDELACMTIRRVRQRMDRGLRDRLDTSLENGDGATAADCIAEIHLLGTAGQALQCFEPLAKHCQTMLRSVGLDYGLVGDGLHVFETTPATAADLPRQKLVLEQLMSWLARCGLGKEHPLEELVRQYLDTEPMRGCVVDKQTAIAIYAHRARAQWMQQVAEDWRYTHGCLWETRQWIDELIDLSVQGGHVLKEKLSTPAFATWLEAMRAGGDAAQAVLASAGAAAVAVAVAMDDQASSTAVMAWLFKTFSVGVDLEAMLMAMPPSVQADQPPVTGIQRLLRLTGWMVPLGQELNRFVEPPAGWSPGWGMLLDFSRFVAAQTVPSPKPDDWLERCLEEFIFPPDSSRGSAKYRPLVQSLWLKALALDRPCGRSLHKALILTGASRDRFDIEQWEGRPFQLLMSQIEPHLLLSRGGMSEAAWVRHNLAKGILVHGHVRDNSILSACWKAALGRADRDFQWPAHWASALMSVFQKEWLRRSTFSFMSDLRTMELAQFWAGAAKKYPDWLKTSLDPMDVPWVQQLIGIVESKDISDLDKPDELTEVVVQWRVALYAKKGQ